MYFFIKFPQFIPAIMICMVTHVSDSIHLGSCLVLFARDGRYHGRLIPVQVMIIGYELQALKVGIQVTESNGQAFYP